MTEPTIRESIHEPADAEQERRDAERATSQLPTVAPPTIATDYVHATHPATGVDVVFVPGEALPAWATAAPEIEQLEGIDPSPAAPDLNALTVPQLKALAEERGIDVSGLTLKAKVIDALSQNHTES